MLTDQIANARDLFDVPRDVAWLNTAYNGPLLRASRLALERAAGAKSRPWERVPIDFFADADRIRTLAAELFGATQDDWAIVPGASYGIATAARALEPALRAGDVILTLAEEFPANVLAWRRAAHGAGARVEAVVRAPGADWTAALLAAIGPTTRVVAVPHCHWTDGAPLDLVAVSRAARAVGAALVLDTTQSLGAMPLDLAGVDPDFMVAAGYKWLLWPYGVGLLYVAPRRQDCRPLEESWLAREGAEDFAGLVRYAEGYRPGARRFDVCETCTALLPGAILALEQLRAWRIERVSARLAELTAIIADGLATRSFEVAPPAMRSPHLLGARLPGAVGLVDRLRAHQVFISQRGESLRFAPHLQVDETDVARLFDVLDRVLVEVRPSASAA